MTIAGFLAYDPNDVRPGWIALFIVLILAIGTFMLWRNMNKQIRKINVPHGAEFRQSGGSGSSRSTSRPDDESTPGTDP